MIDLSGVEWRKSSRSGGQGGQCVEVASLSPIVAIRDSKNPDGPKLVLDQATWSALTRHVRDAQA